MPFTFLKRQLLSVFVAIESFFQISLPSLLSRIDMNLRVRPRKAKNVFLTVLYIRKKITLNHFSLPIPIFVRLKKWEISQNWALNSTLFPVRCFCYCLTYEWRKSRLCDKNKGLNEKFRLYCESTIVVGNALPKGKSGRYWEEKSGSFFFFLCWCWC